MFRWRVFYLLVVALCVCVTPPRAAFSQVQPAADIAGDWQGTLSFSPTAKFRLVLRVRRDADGGLSALNYSIDQGPDPMKTTAVSLVGNTFRFTIASLHGAYEGQLSADSKMIRGTWRQNTVVPLDFVRATKETAWEIPAPRPPRKPMADDADPSFEVATLKPVHPSDTTPKFFRIAGRRYSAHAVSLADLMQVAYSVHPRQITGGPAWMETEKFDLVGVPDGEGEPSVKQWIGMLQKFLATRFQLSFHHEKKELGVYALTVERDGPRNLVKSESNSPFPSLEFRPAPGGVVLPAKNATLGQFAVMMQMVVLDRPVADQTNLPGRFDFELRFTPDDSQFGGHPPVGGVSGEAGPGLFEALRTELGLKLSPAKVGMDVIVVDRAVRPEGN